MGSDTRIYQLHVTLSRTYDMGEKIGKGGGGAKKEDSTRQKKGDKILQLSLPVVKNDHDLQIKTLQDR